MYRVCTWIVSVFLGPTRYFLFFTYWRVIRRRTRTIGQIVLRKLIKKKKTPSTDIFRGHCYGEMNVEFVNNAFVFITLMGHLPGTINILKCEHCHFTFRVLVRYFRTNEPRKQVIFFFFLTNVIDRFHLPRSIIIFNYYLLTEIRTKYYVYGKIRSS